MRIRVLSVVIGAALLLASGLQFTAAQDKSDIKVELKDFKFKERMNAEFRVEFFNVFNHPNVANPWGSQNGWAGGTDLSSPATLGCGCATPDVAGGSPLIGSGGGRDMQLGFKFTF